MRVVRFICITKTKLEQKLFDDLKINFQKERQSIIRKVVKDKTDLWRKNYLFLNGIIGAIDQERDLYKVLFSNNGDQRFWQKLRAILTKEIRSRAQLYNVHLTDKITSYYAQELLIDGLLSLIRAWIDNPHPESVEHFSKILNFSQMLAPIDLLEKIIEPKKIELSKLDLFIRQLLPFSFSNLVVQSKFLMAEP